MRVLNRVVVVSVVAVSFLLAFGAPAEVSAQSVSIRQYMANPGMARGLNDAERRNLHEQFRALPAAEREAFLRSRPSRGNSPSRGPAPTLQYDTGTPNGFRIGTGNSVGNQFNSGFANPHTLSTVTFQLGGNFMAAGDITVFGAPAGSTAPVLFSATLSGAPINTPVALPVGPLTNLSGTFMAGVNQSGTSTIVSTTFVNVAIDTISGGFGFHGMSIFTGGGGGFNPSPSAPPQGGPFNAIIRMTGNNLPVELMDFSVDQ